MSKRILIMTRLMTSGGAERVASNLATQLYSGNDEVWLVVFDGSNATYTTNAPLIDLKLPMKKGVIKKISWYIKCIDKIVKLKKELKITHSISFLNEPDLINVLTPCGAKCLVSVRNNRSSLNKNIFTKTKDKWVFRKADKIIALSEGVKEDLHKNYGVCEDKIKVIYNACDRKRIEKQSLLRNDDSENKLKNNGKTIITAGRLTEQKGQWHLIRAFSEVVKKVPDAQLIILGQGAKKEYLEGLISDLGLENSIKLLGYQKNPYYFMKRADIFVFSSLFEGFGNILLEAMACGLPIISTDCKVGPRELLAPGTSYKECVVDSILEAENGVLVPVCDGKEYQAKEPLTNEEKIMASAIVKLIENDMLLEHYCERSNNRINDFSVERIILQWQSVLE